MHNLANLVIFFLFLLNTFILKKHTPSLRGMSNWRDNLFVFKNKFDVCVIGPRGVGKSTLIHTYIYQKLPDELDLGKENLYTKSISHNNSFRTVTIYDAAGELDISEDHLVHAKSILLCYSLENNRSLLELEDITERIQCRVNPGVIYAVVAIKKDGYRQVKTAIGEAFAESINAVGFYECNPHDDTLTESVFEPLIHAVLNLESDEEKDYQIFPTQILPEHELISRHRKLSIIPSGDEASTIDQKDNAKSIKSLKGEQVEETRETEYMHKPPASESITGNGIMAPRLKNLSSKGNEINQSASPMRKVSMPSPNPKEPTSNPEEMLVTRSKQKGGSQSSPKLQQNRCCVIT